MKRLLSIPVLVGMLFVSPALGQNYTGTYAAPNDLGGQTLLTLRQNGDELTGTLTGNGNTFQLEGTREGESMVGIVSGPAGALLFEAQRDGDELYLTLVSTDAAGQPDFAGATTLLFARTAGDSSGADSGQANPLTPSTATGVAPEDPWVGTFADPTLELTLDGGNGSYEGTIRLGGESFDVSVEGSGKSLSGVFRAGESAFPLELSDEGQETIVLSTDGASYTLTRLETGTLSPLAGGAAANPLSGGGVASNPQAGADPSAAGGSGMPHDGTPLGQEWYQFLAGKKATQMSSYSSGSAGGYSSRTDVHLCRNGRFAMGSSNSVSVDVGGAYGYGGGSGEESGTWRIVTQGQVAGIALTYSNGMVEQYRLDYQDGATYVNGDRWLITPSEACGY